MGASEKTATARVSTLPLLLLPQDILVEILSKLPTISLVRFRCVSKFFCALIADHGFGVLHRSLSLTLPNRAAILIAIIPPKPPSSACPYYTINFSEENPQRPGMLQANRLSYLDGREPFLKRCLHSSSDGLISLSRPNGDVVVCNVCTGQRISLPTIQSYIYLSCPQLGFDSQSKRYKVLMSAYMIDRGSRPIFQYKLWILTVGVDKSWREINYSCSYPFYSYCCNISVYIDGVIYFYNWLTKADYRTFHIVAFEVGSESYSLIPFPAELSSSSQYRLASASITEKYHILYGNFALLQVDGGRLAIVLVRQKDHQFYINVWTWEKSKGCWEKILMTISLEEDRTMSYLRHTTNHAGEIVLLCRNSTQFFIFVCNLKSEVWRKFDVVGIEEFPILFPTDVRMYKTMDNVFGG